MRPRIGFLGVGWIGRHRLEVLARSGVANVVAVSDVDHEACRSTLEIVPEAKVVEGFSDLLELPLDGVVIATPSALHAEQSLAALKAGLAVFCQKPLGRSAREVTEVVSTAAEKHSLLGVDLSYRYTGAMVALKRLVDRGALGHLYALDLVFHNAYGPDKPWFYDRGQAGGGCLIDLGLHLVDAALWLLDAPRVQDVSGRLFREGRRWHPHGDGVEDYAIAEISLEGDRVARIACSWNLPAGRDAVIGVELFGTEGGASMKNVNGSFFDFVADHHVGTSTARLVSPPDNWGGRALVDWAERLSRGESITVEEAAEHVRTAEIIDAIYDGFSAPR